MINNPKEKIESLKEEIREHNRRYFIENDSIISDEEYDKLMRELIELEEKYPEYQDENSPTSRILVDER